MRPPALASGTQGTKLAEPRPTVDWSLHDGRGDAPPIAGNLAISLIRDPSHIDELAAYVHEQSTERAQPVSAPISLGTTLRDCLPLVKARIAGLWGAQDPASAPYMAERIAFPHAIQPNASVIVIPHASHWVAYEASERFDAELLAQLGREGGTEVASR